jgi:GNAT superfamily N-acetyltransferase
MSTLLASYNTSTIVFSSVITKEIEDFYSAEFKQCIEIYKFSFPSNETRPIEKVVEMLRNDFNYHLYISLDCQAVIAISLLYIFSSLNIGLLDYIAVIPSYHRRGVGNALFRFTLKKFNSIVNNGVGLLMEVQREDGAALEEKIARKSTIKFYMNLGGKILDGVRYLLPLLQYGIDPEEMYLIVRPLKQIRSLSKGCTLAYIGAIYTTIYQYQDKDLYKTSQEMPEKIMLRKMVEW